MYSTPKVCTSALLLQSEQSDRLSQLLDEGLLCGFLWVVSCLQHAQTTFPCLRRLWSSQPLARTSLLLCLLLYPIMSLTLVRKLPVRSQLLALLSRNPFDTSCLQTLLYRCQLL